LALRLWKKKMPPREEKMLKQRFTIEEGVFDAKTRITLYEFMNKGIISCLDYPIATGKEADVYRATAGFGLKDNVDFVAAKIFRVETSNFLRMQDYIYTDPRFLKVKRVKREVVYAWAKKEFKNLNICSEARVPAPKPYAFSRNVLLMEFLGEEGIPDSSLAQIGSERPEEDCETLLGYVKRLYQHGFVHADLSEYNVLLHGYPDYKLYLIDLGQGVLTEHPKAEEFLARDVANVLRYFKKYGVKRDFAEVLEWVKKK